MGQIPNEVLDQLVEGYENSDDILGTDGLLAALQKAVVERARQAEMTHHLGYGPHVAVGRGSGNSRTGVGGRTMLTDSGEFEVEVPQYRKGAVY